MAMTNVRLNQEHVDNGKNAEGVHVKLLNFAKLCSR